MNYRNFQTRKIQPQNSRRALYALTPIGFEELIMKVCEASAPKDAEIRVTDDYSARITVERSFAVEATLYINSRTIFSDAQIGTDENDQPVKTNDIKLEIEVNWASTSRNLISAAAAADLYQELIKLGNHISATLSGYDLVMTREIKE
jgi:hypothetical protein